jgi:hypothetical protein
MQRGQKPFGKRRAPIAEFKSIEEDYREGELSKRTERTFAIYITLLLATAVIVVLTFSPESRALALELGAKGIELGRECALRGLLE